MENEKLFELMSKMYGEMQSGFKRVDERLDILESRVTIIEQDHGKKLDLLLDGYKQNAEKIDRIESEVSKYE